MTILKGNKVAVFQDAHGVDVALPYGIKGPHLQGEKCVRAQYADGPYSMVEVESLLTREQQGVMALAGDGVDVPVVLSEYLPATMLVVSYPDTRPVDNYRGYMFVSGDPGPGYDDGWRSTNGGSNWFQENNGEDVLYRMYDLDNQLVEGVTDEEHTASFGSYTYLGTYYHTWIAQIFQTPINPANVRRVEIKSQGTGLGNMDGVVAQLKSGPSINDQGEVLREWTGTMPKALGWFGFIFNDYPV